MVREVTIFNQNHKLEKGKKNLGVPRIYYKEIIKLVIYTNQNYQIRYQIEYDPLQVKHRLCEDCEHLISRIMTLMNHVHTSYRYISF